MLFFVLIIVACDLYKTRNDLVKPKRENLVDNQHQNGDNNRLNNNGIEQQNGDNNQQDHNQINQQQLNDDINDQARINRLENEIQSTTQRYNKYQKEVNDAIDKLKKFNINQESRMKIYNDAKSGKELNVDKYYYLTKNEKEDLPDIYNKIKIGWDNQNKARSSISTLEHEINSLKTNIQP